MKTQEGLESEICLRSKKETVLERDHLKNPCVLLTLEPASVRNVLAEKAELAT